MNPAFPPHSSTSTPEFGYSPDHTSNGSFELRTKNENVGVDVDANAYENSNNNPKNAALLSEQNTVDNGSTPGPTTNLYSSRSAVKENRSNESRSNVSKLSNKVLSRPESNQAGSNSNQSKVQESHTPKVLTCPPGIRIGFCPIKHTFIDFPTTPIGTFPAPPLTTPASFAPALDLPVTMADSSAKPQTIKLSDLVGSPKKQIHMPFGLRQPSQAPGPALAP